MGKDRSVAAKVGGAQIFTSTYVRVRVRTYVRCHINKMAGNCEACVLKALKSRTKKLSLDNKGIRTFPLSVGRLDFLETLSAKNNDLFTLPEEVANLKKVD